VFAKNLDIDEETLTQDNNQLRANMSFSYMCAKSLERVDENDDQNGDRLTTNRMNTSRESLARTRSDGALLNKLFVSKSLKTKSLDEIKLNDLTLFRDKMKKRRTGLSNSSLRRPMERQNSRELTNQSFCDDSLLERHVMYFHLLHYHHDQVHKLK